MISNSQTSQTNKRKLKRQKAVEEGRKLLNEQQIILKLGKSLKQIKKERKQTFY